MLGWPLTISVPLGRPGERPAGFGLSSGEVRARLIKGALILFYKQGALANFRDLFVEQLRFAAANYFL